KGKVEQVSGFTTEEYKKTAEAAKKSGSQKLYALMRLMRFGGLAILDAVCLEREQIIRCGESYRVRLTSLQKTSKKAQPQMVDNAIPPDLGRDLVSVLNGNLRYVFWNKLGEDEATPSE